MGAFGSFALGPIFRAGILIFGAALAAGVTVAGAAVVAGATPRIAAGDGVVAAGFAGV